MVLAWLSQHGKHGWGHPSHFPAKSEPLLAALALLRLLWLRERARHSNITGVGLCVVFVSLCVGLKSVRTVDNVCMRMPHTHMHPHACRYAKIASA